MNHFPPIDTRRRERGYVLAMLLVMCVFMGIYLTRAVPRTTTVVQRELEEELIFRGEAYANAIRQYRARTGNFPTDLEQLIQVRPPILRKLYLCPITNKPFDVVTAVQIPADGNVKGLPISGVRSPSKLNAIKKYKDRELHSEWIFSAAEDLYGGGLGAGRPGTQPPSKPAPPTNPGSTAK